jgi:hypothetical protein
MTPAEKSASLRVIAMRSPFKGRRIIGCATEFQARQEPA